MKCFECGQTFTYTRPHWKKTREGYLCPECNLGLETTFCFVCGERFEVTRPNRKWRWVRGGLGTRYKCPSCVADKKPKNQNPAFRQIVLG